jgi:TetR/AcrR family transcriptional regulator, tetracycline repressor protein
MPRGLTRQAIVAAGLDALGETGLDGLTVRVVADRLGVQPPALYWHVRNKSELIDEMATEIWRQITAGLTPGAAWDEMLTTFAVVMRRGLLAHRDGAKMVSGTYLTDPELLRSQESGLAALTEQGFTVASAVRAYKLMHNFVVGFCIEEQAATGDERYALDRRADRVGPDFPHVIEAGEEIFGDQDQQFADLVAVIVAAAGRMRSG